MESIGFGIKVLHISSAPLGYDFWLRKSSGVQMGRKSWNRYAFGMRTLHISGAPLGSDFWLRKGFGAQTNGKYGIDKFLKLKSYTFLAPLSDPIFGSEKAPEPKRKENHKIDKLLVKFLVFKS